RSAPAMALRADRAALVARSFRKRSPDEPAGLQLEPHPAPLLAKSGISQSRLVRGPLAGSVAQCGRDARGPPGGPRTAIAARAGMVSFAFAPRPAAGRS